MMLRRFLLPDKNHRNVPSIAFLQRRIFIDIHFAQDRVEFPQNRCDGRFRFLAKMAARTRVQSDVARPTSVKPRVFRLVPHGWGFEYFMNGPECG